MNRFAMRQCLAWLLGLALFASMAHAAPVVPVDPALNETVVFVKNNRLLSFDLETTLFMPSGDGPFPVVLINHGKQPGENKLQARYRPLPAVRAFLQRGYAVVAPMRQGFSNSAGNVRGSACGVGASGAYQAEDVEAVVEWLTHQPWADTQRMVMLGQSHGGLTTLAYARHPHPGVRVFVNFAGGLRNGDGSCAWQRSMVDAFGRYGAETKVSTLWFYGANDSFFPPEVLKPAYDAYVAAGGAAELVAYGPFGSDSHRMFGSPRGLSLWWPKVEARLAAAGLPIEISSPQFAPEPPMTPPPATGFAAVDDVDHVPYLKERGREGYRTFVSKAGARAFAIAPNGAFGWAEDGDDPLRRALANCAGKTHNDCRLYAVDGDVVWSER